MLFQAVVIFFAYFEFFQISCKRGKVHLASKVGLRLFSLRAQNTYMEIRKLREAIYICLILQHFLTRLGNFTNFKILFKAAVKTFIRLE